MDRLFQASTSDGTPVPERVAIEEPLQITLDGHPLAVVMRTPGHDEELVRGFLITEGILRKITHIRRLSVEGNHALVFSEDRAFDPAQLRRNLFSASSCGICGKASIDAVFLNFPPLADPSEFNSAALLKAPGKLRPTQAGFEVTGGLHAAALFNREGEIQAVREDVGRHNAVDKVIGYASSAGPDLSQCFLLVSGRVSFEIMQKALAARIPLVAGISAPSSLAVEFAQRSGQGLVAFLRPPKFNLYCGSLG